MEVGDIWAGKYVYFDCTPTEPSNVYETIYLETANRSEALKSLVKVIHHSHFANKMSQCVFL